MFFKWPDPSLFPRCGREEGYTVGETRARLEESRRSWAGGGRGGESEAGAGRGRRKGSEGSGRDAAAERAGAGRADGPGPQDEERSHCVHACRAPASVGFRGRDRM